MPSTLIDDNFVVTTEEIELDQAEELKQRGIALIDAAQDNIAVDLAALTQASSIAVVLLVAWYRHASLQSKSIVFVNLSPDLRNIIEFSGLSQMLVADQ